MVIPGIAASSKELPYCLCQDLSNLLVRIFIFSPEEVNILSASRIRSADSCPRPKWEVKLRFKNEWAFSITPAGEFGIFFPSSSTNNFPSLSVLNPSFSMSLSSRKSRRLSSLLKRVVALTISPFSLEIVLYSTPFLSFRVT